VRPRYRSRKALAGDNPRALATRRADSADQVQLTCAAPSPLPCFLEVLILEGLKRNFSEVLILGDFKSNAENEIRGVLEVLIPEGLKFDFSEVLILGGLRAKNFEL
jgi:hypothetical protein